MRHGHTTVAAQKYSGYAFITVLCNGHSSNHNGRKYTVTAVAVGQRQRLCSSVRVLTCIPYKVLLNHNATATPPPINMTQVVGKVPPFNPTGGGWVVVGIGLFPRGAECGVEDSNGGVCSCTNVRGRT
jgi:hypothetical protein